MALNAPADTAKPAAPAAPQTINLELAIYQRYTRKGKLFTKTTEDGRPQVYAFTPQQAAVLMQEVDEVSQRPIWRRPRVQPTQQQIQIDRSKPVVSSAADLGEIQAIEVDDTSRIGQEPVHPEQRLDDGTDEELAELLGQDLPELQDGTLTQI